MTTTITTTITATTYHTSNLFSGTENRFLYFISDVPHLLKTVRNCLSNSWSSKFTCYMWNVGMFLLWNHIVDIFYEDQECGIHILPKLCMEHIKLTPYSTINVKLAAQVLSYTVSKVLLKYEPPETAKFCSLIDMFFNIMNIRNVNSHKFELKLSLLPLSKVDDPRFSLLRNVFLQYFEDWLAYIEQRPENFSRNAKGKMFIPKQIYEGFKITINSIIEAVQFLLQHEVSYILTEHFCQDPLENCFCHQRSIGARKDNLSLRDFVFNDNAIRNQKVFRRIAGNVRGGQDQSNIEFSCEAILYRKKAKKD